MRKQPFHCTILFFLICLSISLTATAQTVNIPDSNLRAAIAAELGKASGDPITTSDMAALRSLTARLFTHISYHTSNSRVQHQ